MAIIALGSNVEPEVNLPLAVQALADLGRIRGLSAAYENPAVGPSGQPNFVNAAIRLETDLALADLRQTLRAIEDRLGRRHGDDEYAPRTVDLDVCLWDSVIEDDPAHPLPDPDLLLRPYLAVVAAEAAPEALHPVTGEPLDSIARRLARGADLTPRPKLTAALKAVASDTAAP